MKTVLFQGDSITDTGRNPDNGGTGMGQGYAQTVASELSCQNPGEYVFLNRGISGNRVVDLYARWKADCLNLKPDYISILVGVNDVGHEIALQNGVDANRFEMIYDMLLTETKAALPNCRIMLLEPFLLRHKGTEEHWEYYKNEVALRGKAVEKLAKKHKIPYIPLQSVFDEALERASVDFWSSDGVHPTVAGHGLIAHQWLNTFNKYFGE